VSVRHRDRGSFLKRRALAFLEDARSDFMREEYDLVLFHVEQFVQLYLKHLLYLKLGEFPKTHSPSELFKLLARVYNREEVIGFYRENLDMLNLLEDAYISSRYLPRTFSREVAERALAFSERLLEVFSWLERN
jgi:HEPN domain-containing protein